jgi:hypothetical protein
VDLHHNLFYSYRGPIIDAADSERQLENNLTKALINMLSLGGEAVWRPFLNDLGLADATGTKFLLQRRNLPAGSAAMKRDRILLGISKKKSAWEPDAGADAGETYESVPDAWVYGEKFAVLVESKVNDDDFSQGQMQAHLARLRSIESGTPAITRKKTWGQIHRLFNDLLPKLTESSAQLLVQQFIQFLEYSGMSEFTGFRLDHFNYFLLHDDEDARRWILGQLRCFAKAVRDRLREFEAFYEDFDVGNLKRSDSECWVAFGPKGDAYRKVTHQTLSLGPGGLRVYVNIELKPATDRLKSVLKKPNAPLLTALRQLHEFEPFELKLDERTQRQFRTFDYIPKMMLHSSLLIAATDDAAWSVFARTVDRLPLPYLRIERLVSAQTLIELSKGGPDAVVQLVVEMFQKNDPVVKMLNA